MSTAGRPGPRTTGRAASFSWAQAAATVFEPITRCAAPDVDPATALRDIEVTARLHEFYGHLLCGIYVQVSEGGEVEEGRPRRRS